MTPSTRIKWLVEQPRMAGGKYVLYWMQQSQRTRLNHALEEAIAQANRLGLPVVVGFGLTDRYPEANARHYAFMLQGLRDVRRNLATRGIRLVVRCKDPAEAAVELSRQAVLVVCDRGYLRRQKQWRARLSESCASEGRPVLQVETDAVVPVEVASNRREFAARTLRPKIDRHLTEHLVPVRQQKPARSSLRMRIASDLDVSDPAEALQRLRIDGSVAPVAGCEGGEEAGRRRLRQFVETRLAGYAAGRSDPAAGWTSRMSPYLHFGQISPLEIALAVNGSAAPAADREALLEELIIRRELSFNFCEFTEDYDSYDALPGWAKQTLREHADDPRPHLYTREALERASTHDPYWNAAQREMIRTGFMHNSMRMYWGKKILEWTVDPRQAFETILWLNNRFFLCGRDPVSYANVGWIFGLHDRPWGPARKIFGTVRYMNAAGLERKFDIQKYVRQWDAAGESP